ncbi:MAG: 50S ribosomal protein L11 methyltransferase [Anaerolineae bacterium]|nr:50S ribosomal protein L11 methyltransferase [Anaerolineae bacterium]
MDFIEISIANIDGEAAETVSELFNRYGYGGAVIETFPPDFQQATVRTVIPKEDDARLRKIEAMLALIGQALPTGLPKPKLQLVGKTDWATAWKAHFHVIRIGQRFVIKPSWRDYDPAPDDLVMEIDPGLAFGSGLHPTTQLCLKIFETLPLTGKSVFDVGTGSAVLSLAALLLGAGPLRAVDVDEVAVRVAQENFERNGFALDSPQVTTAIGSAESNGSRTWQVVVANILAHILIEIMADLRAALAPDGVLILSGIINEQEADMRAALAVYRLEIIERHVKGDWVAFVTKQDNG